MSKLVVFVCTDRVAVEWLDLRVSTTTSVRLLAGAPRSAQSAGCSRQAGHWSARVALDFFRKCWRIALARGGTPMAAPLVLAASTKAFSAWLGPVWCARAGWYSVEVICMLITWDCFSFLRWRLCVETHFEPAAPGSLTGARLLSGVKLSDPKWRRLRSPPGHLKILIRLIALLELACCFTSLLLAESISSWPARLALGAADCCFGSIWPTPVRKLSELSASWLDGHRRILRSGNVGETLLLHDGSTDAGRFRLAAKQLSRELDASR